MIYAAETTHTTANGSWSNRWKAALNAFDSSARQGPGIDGVPPEVVDKLRTAIAERDP